MGLAILLVMALSIDFSIAFRYSDNLASWAGLTLFLLAFATLIPRTWRWQLLVNDQQNRKVSFANSFKFQLVGTALNLVLPSGGGDVVKSYFAYHWTGIKERMLAVSLYDKILAVASLSILSLFAFLYTNRIEFILAAIISIFPFVILNRHKQFLRINWVKRVEAYLVLKIQKIDIAALKQSLTFSNAATAWAFVFCIIGWISDYFLLYFCFVMLDVPIDIWRVLSNGPLLTLGRLFPFTFNGLGTDEALMIFLFSQHDGNFEKDAIFGAALLYRLIMLIIPALPGLYYIYFWRTEK